jgi:hypothetical protein
MKWHPTMDKIMKVLKDGRPRSSRGVSMATGLSMGAVLVLAQRVVVEDGEVYL